MSLRIAAPIVSVLVLIGSSASALEPASPGVDAASPAREPVPLDLGLRFGFGHRFGQGSTLPVDGRDGGVFGFAATISPSRHFGVSLGWEHSGIGSEHGAGDVAEVDATRSIDVLWATLRLAIYRTDRFAILGQLGPGLGFQHVSASVLLYPAVGQVPSATNCSATGGPSLGLRLGLGAEVRVAGPLWLGLDALFDHHATSDAPLGDCAPGAGSLSIAGARLGLAYRVDITRWTR